MFLCEFEKIENFFSCRVRLSCKIINFIGLHTCQSIHRLKMEIYNPPAENKAAQATSMHLNFPCGIIRGALLNFRIPRAVTADISNLPACEY